MKTLYRALFGLKLTTLVAAIWFCAAPARAAVVADFNGDGVLDRVVPSKAPGTGIIVSISGSLVPQILKLADPPLSIVAADFDHDGKLDISAVSQRHRLYIWLNRGRGLFKFLHRKFPHRQFHAIRLQPPHPGLSSVDRSGEIGPPEQTNSWLVFAVEHARAKILPPSGAHVLPRAQAAPISVSFGSSAPRAPPRLAPV